MKLGRQELIDKIKTLAAEIETLRLQVRTSFWADEYIDSTLDIAKEELNLVYEELMK